MKHECIVCNSEDIEYVCICHDCTSEIDVSESVKELEKKNAELLKINRAIKVPIGKLDLDIANGEIIKLQKELKLYKPCTQKPVTGTIEMNPKVMLTNKILNKPYPEPPEDK